MSAADNSPMVELLPGVRHDAPDDVLRAIVAAVEHAVRDRLAGETSTPQARPAYRMWRFSGRNWAAPGPLSRQRPLR